MRPHSVIYGLAIVLLAAGAAAERDVSFLEKFIVPFRIFREARFRQSLRQAQTTRNFRNLKEEKRLQPFIEPSTPFPCRTEGTRSEKVPTSVHKLRPGDIDVIGAMGDSLTAGIGLLASDLSNLLLEDRGASFSIGGHGTWRDTLTLPNILKEFNPKLFGYSLGPSLSIHKASQFNVGEGGAISKNMPYMAKVLVKRITSDPRVDVKRHWKMITLMIGDNDFCTEFCYNDINSILRNHHDDLVQALRILKYHLPRTIVNVIPPPSIKILATLPDRPAHCALLTHSVACPCIMGLVHRNMREYYFQLMDSWQRLQVAISMEPEFNTNDFAVVAQPMWMNFTYPKTPEGRSDYSFNSVDCFHFSQKGNAAVANALWNNLLDPVGCKSTNVLPAFEKFNCPTPERPYLFTGRNSVC